MSPLPTVTVMPNAMPNAMPAATAAAVAAASPAAAPASRTAPVPCGAAGEATAFGHALQRAQRAPKAARETHAKTADAAGDASAQPMRDEPADTTRGAAAKPKHLACDPLVEEADDAGVATVTADPSSGDTSAPIPLPAPGLAAVPQAAIEPRGAVPDRDASVAAVEGREPACRTPVRNASLEGRAAPAGRAAVALRGDVTVPERASGSAQPPHALEPAVPASAAAGPRAASLAAVPASDAAHAPALLAAPALPAAPLHGSVAPNDAKVVHASMPFGIDEPQFGAALGHQVALWVRDGVQEARLQLHPAELGPVSVQIALDGQAAHVEFGAALAGTRESIQQSLPALAAALRESGFTLAGGGVSSHAGGHGDAPRGRAGAPHGDRSQRDGIREPGTVAAAPRRWVRSLLDVYA